MRILKVKHHPPQKRSFGAKTAICGPKLAFMAKYLHFGPFDPMPDQKQCKQVALVVFRYVGTKTLSYSQKRQNLAKSWHFWPNIGIFGPFDTVTKQKTMQKTSCLDGFPLYGYQYFYLLP